MFSDCRVHTALPAIDLERARRFYAETFGLEPSQERPEGLTYDCADGTTFFLFPTAIADRAGHTQVAFQVPDIEEAVRALTALGIVFEEYDSPDLATVDGIATTPSGTRGAWFKDSEGNTLAIAQFS